MTDLRLVSTLEKFIASPSTSGLLEVLEGASSGEIKFCDATREQLVALAERQMLATHDDILSFNEQLWKALGRALPPIPWEQVETYRDPEANSATLGSTLNAEQTSNLKDFCSAVSSDLDAGHGLSVTPSTAPHNQDATELKAGNRAGESTSNPLLFFSQVDAYFVNDNAFSQLAIASKDLADILIPLCTNRFLDLERVNTCSGLTDEDMEWVSTLTAKGLAAIIAHIHSTESDACQFSQHTNETEHAAPSTPTPSNDKTILSAASEAIALTSTMVLTATAAYSVTKYRNSPISIITECLRYISREHPALTMLQMCTEAIGKGTSQVLNPMICLAIVAIGGHRFMSASNWEKLISKWLFYSAQMGGDGEEEEPTLMFRSLTRSIAYENIPERKRLDALLFVDPAASKEIFDLSRTLILQPPTRDLSTFLLRNVFSFQDDDELELEFVAKQLCDDANRKFEETGFPAHVALLDSIDSFNSRHLVHKFPVYYRCLSTLAINLISPESEYEHFRYGEPNECFVAAAHSILNAGYSEHATVFVSYVMLRMNFILNGGIGKMSVKRFSQFLDLPAITPHVPRYIIPAVQIIRERNPNLDTSARVWIDSLIRKHEKSKATLLSISPGGKEALATKTQLESYVPPPWFEGCDEEFDEILKRANSFFCQTGLDDRGWNIAVSRGRILQDLSTICLQLEAESKHLFSDFYNLCTDSAQSQFRSRLKLASRGRTADPDGRLDWGWIEHFLRICENEHEPNEKATAFSGAVVLADTYKSDLGAKLNRLRRANHLIEGVRYVRTLRNTYIGHTDSRASSTQRGTKKRLTLADARWLHSYATSGFRDLWEIMKVTDLR